ncbi:hypothetical protein CDV31_016997, partial [Fusarium ambrosium]
RIAVPIWTVGGFLHSDATIGSFLATQWTVLAPILDLKDGHPIEIQLDEKCALEFPKCEDRGNAQFSHVFFAEIPSQEEEGEPSLVAVKKFLERLRRLRTRERQSTQDQYCRWQGVELAGYATASKAVRSA